MTNPPGYDSPSAPGSTPGVAPLSPSDDTLWASLAHFGNILGVLPSLLIFLILKDRGAKVRVEAKEALNWVITLTIAVIVLAVVSSVLGALGHIPVLGVLFGLLAVLVSLLSGALYIVNIVFSIIGGLRVQQGGSYRYPYSLRLIK